MTKSYNMLILGYDPEDLSRSYSSISMLTFCTKAALRKLEHIKIRSLPIVPFKPDQLPEVDFVLLICYTGITPEQINLIREKTKAKKIMSLCEINFIGIGVDYSFIFNPDCKYDGYTSYICLPCPKNLLTLTPKEPKTILIDHCWESFVGTGKDITYEIEVWLDDIKREYKIYRMIRPQDKFNHRIMDFEIPLTTSDYLTYLDHTSAIENFIVTHHEGYPYGVIDMAARGTRVLMPKGFIARCMVESLGIPTFTSKYEMLDIITAPIEPTWSNKVDACTDYDTIANEIDSKIQEWIDG